MSSRIGHKTKLVSGGDSQMVLSDLHPTAFWFGVRVLASAAAVPDMKFFYSLYMGDFCSARGYLINGVLQDLPMKFTAAQAKAVDLKIFVTPVYSESLPAEEAYYVPYQLRLFFDEMP